MAFNRGGGRNYGGNQQKQSYPNSGALFPNNDKKSEKAPDVNGNIVLSEDVLEYILNHANDGEVKLELSGWDRQAQSGINFLSLKVQTPYAERQQGYGSPGRSRFQPRPQGDRDERAQYGKPQQGNYAQQSRGEPYRGDGNYAGNPSPQGGRMRTAPNQQIDPRYGPPMSEEEFQQGDSMPDFMRD